MHGQFAPLKRLLLAWQAARYVQGGRPRSGIAIDCRGTDASRAATAISLHKAAGRLVAIDADLDWLRSRNGFSTAWRRLGVFVGLVSHPAVADGEWRADLSDFVHDEGPVLGFCSNLRESLLIPDRGFQTSGGYSRQRRQALAAPAFDDRDDTILWRGSPTGSGALANATMQAGDADLRQRIRMCLLLSAADRTNPQLRVDVRIVPGRNATADVAAAYRLGGIAGGSIPEDSWLGRKFAIDIDGHANAFSNLFIRLLYGCCVIKIASPAGFRQWYYDRLEPWRHYIPVADDLSDLVERIVWCRANPDACRSVAAAGRSLALSVTPAGETRRTIELIRNRPWRQGP